ncbi:MAG: alpha-hydroxy-acid oxidizing protein [Spirochaetales bacterium]|nr:alpha-hydroxy-acid oxidizing protein [Spirochaetales bacterium]
MQRSIIIIGGGLLQTRLIEAAKTYDLHTIVFDRNSGAPGLVHADEVVLVDTLDAEAARTAALNLAGRFNICGVLTAGTDASQTVAAIAAELKLPGVSRETARAASNKIIMRETLRRAGLPVPDFRPVYSLNDARSALREMSLPLVLKPAENMGARGVILIRDRSELEAAFRHTRNHLRSPELIIEEFMPGPELSVDALAWRGGLRKKITGIADRHITGEPFFIETGHTMPSTLDVKILEEAEQVMFAAMDVLGIREGAGKGDLKFSGGRIMIGEIAARLSGGFMSSHTYPYSSGVNLYRAAIQIALGEEPDALEPTQSLYALERAIIAPAGKVQHIDGRPLQNPEEFPGLKDVILVRSSGDIVPQLTSNVDKMGNIIVTAENLSVAEERARSVLGAITVQVDSSYAWTRETLEARARERFSPDVCHVCKSCDGQNCASGIPGMGGPGQMQGFRDNSSALLQYTIVPRYLQSAEKADASFEFLGRKLSMPIMAAPMTGATTNFQNAISEFDLGLALARASRAEDTIAWIGDGSSPEKWKTIESILEAMEGFAILILKPRADLSEIKRRIRIAERLKVPAVGMDVDARLLRTMQKESLPLDRDTLLEIRRSTDLPFITKGILSSADAVHARAAGSDVLVVSNHGGRILDSMPGAARVLPRIADEFAGELMILADGGVRSGADAFKYIALGARAVLTGRPLAIAAVGGQESGVRFVLRAYRSELIHTMQVCGTPELSSINRDYLEYLPQSEQTAVGQKEG